MTDLVEGRGLLVSFFLEFLLLCEHLVCQARTGETSTRFSRAQSGKPCFARYRAKIVRRKGVPFLGGLGTCGFELPHRLGYVVPGNA